MSLKSEDTTSATDDEVPKSGARNQRVNVYCASADPPVNVPQHEVTVQVWRRPDIDKQLLIDVVDAGLRACGINEPATVAIKLTTDRVIRELNRRYRQADKATDVLSFANLDWPQLDNHVGDLAISVETAARQASDSGLSLGRELQELALHGTLHLLGYDHATDHGQMDRLELDLREKLFTNGGLH